MTAVEDDSMRLFVALVPPPAAVAELRAVVDAVRARHPGPRWTAPDSWHITLAFLGEIDTATRDRLKIRLARVASRHPAPVLALEGGGRFGDNTLWVGMSGDRRELSALATGVRRAAVKCRIPVEDRPWHGHLTLARTGARRPACWPARAPSSPRTAARSGRRSGCT
ncbi:RNA 2',3'-cyclic phosphodiesterase [Streptacidiphilus rugosus]|uniref:RNA 2',3'-cyclic phosphodiesterase n=1 Tax=Streptacidiphilus rugosus TaxID=405783 RepID=UPI000B30727A|nr:RNA 2',3'-cyclic phosphodiesterase [Streptacidiphilus rugosus]